MKAPGRGAPTRDSGQAWGERNGGWAGRQPQLIVFASKEGVLSERQGGLRITSAGLAMGAG